MSLKGVPFLMTVLLGFLLLLVIRHYHYFAFSLVFLWRELITCQLREYFSAEDEDRRRWKGWFTRRTYTESHFVSNRRRHHASLLVGIYFVKVSSGSLKSSWTILASSRFRLYSLQTLQTVSFSQIESKRNVGENMKWKHDFETGQAIFVVTARVTTWDSAGRLFIVTAWDTG